MTNVWSRFGWLVSILGVAISAAAQEPANFSASPTELVVLSVVVKDRHGRDVSDLARERFTIFDDGRPQPIALFGDADMPVSAGIVIDRSGSMRAKLDEVVLAALEFARTSNPDDELFALSFNEHVRESSPAASLGPADVSHLEDNLRRLTAVGETALYDSLIAGLDHLRRATHPRKMLVLVSDGADNASEHTLADVLARARQENVSIYTIGLFDRDQHDRNPKVLQAIAEATGGERYLPSSPSALLGACKNIAREIRGSYTLAFEPPKRDGAYHKIRVEVPSSHGDLSVRTRPGYSAGLTKTEERP